MREIVFDTETTGFEPGDGHRVVEIGCVELLGHFPTGRTYQTYLNPERLVPIESQRVHGLSDEFLADKPLFANIVEEFLAFIGDATLVIHNASFDIKFINAELTRTGHAAIPLARAIDTLEIAKRKLPGARYSLDELCKRFGVDLTARAKHGALLDADLTAQIYLELIGGRQKGLALAPADVVRTEIEVVGARVRPKKLASQLTPEEAAAHSVFVVKELGDKTLWPKAS